MPDHQDYDEETFERDDAIVGVALKWSLVAFVLIAVIALPVIYILNQKAPEVLREQTELAQAEVRHQEEIQLPAVSFTDITSAAGITFKHENGARGQKLLPETMGGGCAFFDFDNDGDQDLLLVNSQTWEVFNGEAVSNGSTSVLYENDGTGKFKDVTAGSGLDVSLYGMGVACGDYDGDGLVDLYFSAVGPNHLFHNLGNGKFEDVTDEAGVSGGAKDWGTSCGWFDYDRDGDLDLFVANYVEWSQEYDLAQDFKITGGDRAYGRPQSFEGSFPNLFRNNGEGNFTDVTEDAGLQMRNPATNVPMAKSLGVTFDDFDGDGWLDIFVANDTVQNFLFHNDQNGTFSEVGAVSGVAFDANGAARGAMGLDAACIRNNDCIGIAIGNFSNEMTALYVSQNNEMQFVDEAISSGMGPSTRLSLTFGVFFFDYDLDGRLDLFASNGHLEEDIHRVQQSQYYEQPPQMFWNCGPEYDTEFVPVPENVIGADFTKPLVGRGAAYADIDGDGDLDVLIMTTGRTPRLLQNNQPAGQHWVRFFLEGDRGNRQAIGGRVSVEVGDAVLTSKVMPTRSYISQVELPVTFGLGRTASIGKVTIQWPDGTVQELEGLAIDRLHHIKKQVEVSAKELSGD